MVGCENKHSNVTKINPLLIMIVRVEIIGTFLDSLTTIFSYTHDKSYLE